MRHLGPGASQQAGSLPPRMFPRGIPSAALPTQSQVPSGLCSSRASRMLDSLSLASSGHLSPHGQPGGDARPPPVPLRFTASWLAAHPQPQRSSAPRPATSCFVPHTMPPAPKNSPRDALGIALRERRSCRPHRTLARPPPGATASSDVLVIPGASALLSSFVQLGHSCGNA